MSRGQPPYATFDQDGLVVTPPRVWGGERASRVGNELVAVTIGCLGLPLLIVGMTGLAMAISTLSPGPLLAPAICAAVALAVAWIGSRLGVQQELRITPREVVLRRQILGWVRETRLATRGLSAEARVSDRQHSFVYREIQFDGPDGSAILVLPPTQLEEGGLETAWIVGQVRKAVAIAEAGPTGGEPEMRAALQGVLRGPQTEKPG